MKTLHYKGLCLRALLLTLMIGATGVLPLLGVWLAGKPVADYFAFPPLTHLAAHAPFSWPMFAALGMFAIAVAGLIAVSLLLANRQPTSSTRHPLPWWGWAGMVLAAGAWFLAWTRFTWFAPYQVLVFTPLWVGYVVVINALTFRRTGGCLMTRRAGLFVGLFPLSAIFWWLFEYLNRFAQNWYYPPLLALSPPAYFVLATLPFSTVLPAVLSTAEWLGTFPRFGEGSIRGVALLPRRPRRLAAWLMGLAGLGLAGLGVWPDLLFPLLWGAPLVLLLGLAVLCGQTTVVSDLMWGEWTRLLRYALAALVCGIFWEFWNVRSAAHWVYAVPYVHRFLIFEMPLLGYIGYLPFGLECIAIVDFLLGGQDRSGV